MVIYHYPAIGIIFISNFARSYYQNYPNLVSNYYPKYTFWVIYPFLINLGEFLYKVAFPEHFPIVLEDMAMFYFWWYPVSDR